MNDQQATWNRWFPIVMDGVMHAIIVEQGQVSCWAEIGGEWVKQPAIPDAVGFVTDNDGNIVSIVVDGEEREPDIHRLIGENGQ